MKLFVFLLLAALPLVAAAQTQHITFKQDGEFANFSDPSSNTSLSVSRTSSTSSAANATLNYSTFRFAPDFSSVTFIQITGTIPARSFTGHNTQHLILDFDTSQLDPTNSVSQSCTIDLINFTPPVCGPGPLGLIHLEFQENGLQRTRVLNFDEEIISGLTTTHIHQRSDNSTANMQGSLFGMPISSTSATVGVNHNSSLEVIKN